MDGIITAQEYAKKAGCHPTYITLILKSQEGDYSLPGALSVGKHGATWMIRLSPKPNFVKIRKELKNYLVKSK